VNKGIAICSTPREAINDVNQLCKQEAVKKSLILHTYHADKRTIKHCGVSFRTVYVRGESKEGNEGSPLHTPGRALKNLKKFKSLTILICVWLEEESQTFVEKRKLFEL
jgi:hypothetical protein